MGRGFAIAVGACAATGLGLGWMVGRSSAPPESSNIVIVPEVAPAPGKSAAPADPMSSVAGLRGLLRASGGDGTDEIEARLAKMDAGQVAALAREMQVVLQAAPHPGIEDLSIFEVLLERWARLEPEAAFQFANASTQRSVLKTSVPAVISAMAETDPEAARKMTAGIADPRLRHLSLQVAFERMGDDHPDLWVAWAKEDPSLATRELPASVFDVNDPAKTLARLKDLPPSLQVHVPNFAGIWAAKDPAAAMAWASSLENGTQRNKALASIGVALALKDPDSALATLAGLPPAARREAMKDAFVGMAQKDFAATAEKLSGLSGTEREFVIGQLVSTAESSKDLLTLLNSATTPATRERLLSRLGSSMTQMPGPEVIEALKNVPQVDREKVAQSLVTQHARTNPERALELLKLLPVGKDTSALMISILQTQSQRDPAGALKSALALDEPALRRQGSSIAIGDLVTKDPKAAVAALNTLPSDLRADALASLSWKWAQTDVKGALVWAESLGGKERQDTVSRLLPDLARADPKTATEKLSTLLAATQDDPDHRLSSAATGIAMVWSRSDPAAASTWALGLPEGQRDSTVRNVMYTWTREDPAAAGEWLNTLPKGASRDAGAGALVEIAKQRDPAMAFQWAVTISDESARGYSLADVVERWGKTDHEAARAALENANLSPAVRQSLLKKLK